MPLFWETLKEPSIRGNWECDLRKQEYYYSLDGFTLLLLFNEFNPISLVFSLFLLESNYKRYIVLELLLLLLRAIAPPFLTSYIVSFFDFFFSLFVWKGGRIYASIKFLKALSSFSLCSSSRSDTNIYCDLFFDYASTKLFLAYLFPLAVPHSLSSSSIIFSSYKLFWRSLKLEVLLEWLFLHWILLILLFLPLFFWKLCIFFVKLEGLVEAEVLLLYIGSLLTLAAP